MDFSALVRENMSAVYSFVVRLVGDVELAEDIVQETFLKAWRNLARYDRARSFRTWLFAIARNTAIDRLRERWESTFSGLGEEGEDFSETVPDPSPLPDELVARLQEAEEAARLIGSLDLRYREVVILRLQEELTFEEIGTILARPLHTVKSQYRRAILLLRDRHAPKP